MVRRRSRVTRKLRGSGFFSKIWKGIKKGASAIGNAVNDSLKQTKVLSSLASTLPGPLGEVAGQTATNLGYGRRRKVVRRKVVRRKVGGSRVRKSRGGMAHTPMRRSMGAGLRLMM